jgi:hypothetical protein
MNDLPPQGGLAVPDLTRNAGVQLNERVSLQRPCKLLTLSQSRDLADAALSGGHEYRAIRGRCCVTEAAAPPDRVWTESSMTRRRRLDPLDRNGRMLDNLARNSFEFCFCG